MVTSSLAPKHQKYTFFFKLKVFWWNEAVEVIEATEAVEAIEVIEAIEVFKALEITTEDFRVIQASKFSFIFMFWKI